MSIRVEPAVPHPDLPFDPATGEWRTVPTPNAAAPSGMPGSSAPNVPSGIPPTPPDARRPGVGAKVWDVVLALDLSLLGLAFLALGIMIALDAAGITEMESTEATTAETRALLYGQAALNIVAMAIVPLAWGWGTRVAGLRGALIWFRLDRFWPDAGKGVLWGLGILAAMTVVGIAVDAIDRSAGTELADNPELEAIGAAMTIPLAVATALSAAVGEEVLFRGFLQRKIGLWGQAILFGLAHMSYATVLQVVLPFALGILFGVLVRRGATLWLPILAHFVYDIVALLAARAIN